MQYENEIIGNDIGPDPVLQALPAASGKHSATRSALLLLRDIAIAFAILILVLLFVKPTIVFEHSMENTLHPEDYVFLAKQAYHFGEVSYGDIVVFESKLSDEHGLPKNLIKRVVGKPGDVIEIKDGSVWRNGDRLIENYTKDGATYGEMTAVTVPQGAYFMLGDNRQVSKDSRDPAVGFISEDTIKGKVVFRLFPLSAAGRVS